MYNLFNNILKARCYAGFLYGMHSCLSAYNNNELITPSEGAPPAPPIKILAIFYSSFKPLITYYSQGGINYYI